jgi:murein DD-endopeptidase MepM/ murein hydrolase activator NlpD
MFYNRAFIIFFALISWSVQTAFSQNQFKEVPIDFLDDSVSYLWPTDASPYLSSTFAETRSAHLHSGIDIRTWGREGYRVFASRDGVIYRLGIGPHGYGNVIYMKHGDDSFTVYAHLNRFEPELQALTDSIRLIDYTFELDLNLEDRGIHYKQGDVIGYTGSTGVGPPHLHFEIRTPDFKPINPLLTNLSVTDNIPPVFSQLAVELLDSKTLQRTGHTILPVTTNGNDFDFGEITVSGPVGLAVNTYDRADRTPNSYAVYSLKLIHDADTLFHSTADYFSFRDGRNMFLDRSYPILAQTRRGFQRLYKVEGNRLPFYHKKVNEGVLKLEQGSYPVTIIAKDIYGNESLATLIIHFEDTAERDDISYVPAYPGYESRTDFTYHRWRQNEIPISHSFLASAMPDITIIPSREVPHFFTSTTTAVKKLHPAKTEIISSPDQKLWVQFPREAIYDTLDIKMSVNIKQSLIDITFNPNRLPVGDSVQFNYILPDEFKDKERLALFSVDHYRNRESFISSEISDGIIRATINEISDLRLKEDRIAPWVGRPRIEKNLAGIPVLYLPVTDQMTRIDFRRSEITVNSLRGIIEYDPENNFLIYYHPEFKPGDLNSVTYRVFDGAGNQTSETVNVSYRD